MSRGFTLVEVMVAMAIFSLAVVALISAQTTSLKTVQTLDSRAFADIAADNVLVRTIISPERLTLGFTRGREEVAGRPYEWTRNIQQSGRGDIVAITIDVREQGGEQVLSSISGFRGNR